MIKAAIAGATGYTGGELIRVLLNHPDVELKWLTSTSLAGESVSDVHRDLFGECNLRFTDEIGDPDVLFLALGHGLSKKFIETSGISPACKIIDLGSDFRMHRKSGEKNIAYGMSELFKDDISTADIVANPGCFATAITLGLAPLAKAGLLKGESHIHAVTGSTGAGKALSQTSHFSYREGNMSVYKPFKHQHLAEITETLERVGRENLQQINFVPMRGDFTRGIIASMYTEIDEHIGAGALMDLYRNTYDESPFVHLSEDNISLKEVVNTNKAILHLERHGKYIHITSIIDNLLKGASGQAVQNMNIMFDLPQERALKLKGIAF